MMKRKIFMISHDSDVNKGGINSVMFSRSHLFDNDKYSSDIVTLDYKGHYHEIEQQLKDDGRLSPNSKIINVYDYYRDKFSTGQVNEEMQEHYAKNLQKEEGNYHYNFEGDVGRYFENGQYVKFKRWDENGRLLVVDYFMESRVRIAREEYHVDGYMSKKTTYHPSTNKTTQVHYYTKEGFCYLTSWFNFTTGKQIRVLLFNPKEKHAVPFVNFQDFHTYFLNELCSLQDVKPIVICDGPSTARKVQGMSPDKAVRIYTLHSHHLEAPYEFGGKIKERHSVILSNPDNLAPVVVLTERQKDDIEKQLSDHKLNLRVISHALDIEKVNVEKQDNLIVIVGRFSEIKRFSLLVDAFKIVLDSVPDAKLHFYGEGSTKEKIKTQISKLKIQDSVSLMPYTVEKNEKLASALFTINTSEFEGQGLVILEAMAQKTPVLAFDISYIVREVQDNIAGKVVPNGDVEKLAEAMIDWLYKPEEVKALGEKAQEIIRQDYSINNQYVAWDSLFESEIERLNNAVLVEK